jgi:hypothetical protein
MAFWFSHRTVIVQRLPLQIVPGAGELCGEHRREAVEYSLEPEVALTVSAST